MQLLTKPPKSPADLTALYERTPRDGMLHTGLVYREHYDIADDFDDDWSCAGISWQAGGEETYRFRDERPIKLRSAAALTLAQGSRYAYDALGEAPFRTNMISFPHWITQGASKNMLDDGPGVGAKRRLETRLIRPDEKTQSLMDEIAARMQFGGANDPWFAEKCTLLYAVLLDAQDARVAAGEQINAIKGSTRSELTRRCGFAKQTMLERYDETGLSLTMIAREARLSPYHLIRIFKTVTGVTPIQYLTMVRMDAALRLLKSTKLSISAIASAVGYSDRTAFYRAFRKHYDCAPSAVAPTDARLLNKVSAGQ